LRIVIAATPEVAIPSLDAILESEHELISVITPPDRPAGRGLTLTESPVSQWARNKNVPTHKPERDADLRPFISGVDLLITIGYGVILAQDVFNTPKFGSLNLHFSLLPRWRGAAPVQRAIEAGDSVSGVTVFALDEGMDTGPIYTQMRFALDSDINSDELLKELADLGAQALLQSLSEIEAGKKPTAQNNTEATRALKLSKEEGRIDWNSPADVISRKVRAFTSTPGAWTKFRGTHVKIDSPIVAELEIKPGEIQFVDKKLFVGTTTHALEIGYVTPQGRSRMIAPQWANGARITAGEIFG
jgi:methionyl-tRNA formyltransferase